MIFGAIFLCDLRFFYVDEIHIFFKFFAALSNLMLTEAVYKVSNNGSTTNDEINCLNK